MNALEISLFIFWSNLPIDVHWWPISHHNATQVPIGSKSMPRFLFSAFLPLFSLFISISHPYSANILYSRVLEIKPFPHSSFLESTQIAGSLPTLAMETRAKKRERRADEVCGCFML